MEFVVEVALMYVGGRSGARLDWECRFDGLGEYVPCACRPAGAGAYKGEQRAANKLALPETQASRRAGVLGCPDLRLGVTGPSYLNSRFLRAGCRFGGWLTCQGKVGRRSLCLGTGAVELWSIVARIAYQKLPKGACGAR